MGNSCYSGFYTREAAGCWCMFITSDGRFWVSTLSTHPQINQKDSILFDTWHSPYSPTNIRICFEHPPMPNIAKPSSLNALEQVSTRRYINPQRTQQKLVAGLEHVLFSVKYMGCHPNPIDFHSHVSRWAHCTSNQKNRQGQLGESLQHHQDLLGRVGSRRRHRLRLRPRAAAAEDPRGAWRSHPETAQAAGPRPTGRRSQKKHIWEEAEKMEEQQDLSWKQTWKLRFFCLTKHVLF